MLFLAILAQLPTYFLWATTTGTHSLCYDVIINSKPEPGQQWCTVEAQVDQKNFLSYDCGMDKVKSLNAFGGKVNATVTWKYQNTMLREMGNTLKRKLADIKAENYMARGLHTLEGRMFCQRKSNGCTRGSWQLGFNGETWLLFDSDNRKWTDVHPGSNWMKKMWESDRDVTEFLHKSSMGDCRAWLEKFLEQWKPELEPTGPSSTTSDGVLHNSAASTLIPLSLLLTLTCFIQLIIQQSFLTGAVGGMRREAWDRWLKMLPRNCENVIQMNISADPLLPAYQLLFHHGINEDNFKSKGLHISHPSSHSWLCGKPCPSFSKD